MKKKKKVDLKSHIFTFVFLHFPDTKTFNLGVCVEMSPALKRNWRKLYVHDERFSFVFLHYKKVTPGE